MNKLFRWIKVNYRMGLAVLLFLFCSFLVLWLFPGQAKFKWEFDEGRPWTHETLYAPFDFSVYKTQSELNHERDSVKKECLPYYDFDETIVDIKKEQFSKVFEKVWTHHINKYYRSDSLENIFKPKKEDTENDFSLLKNDYQAFCLNMLEKVYERGIIKLPESAKAKVEDYSFFMVKGKFAEEYDLEEVYTLLSAENFIKKEISNKKEFASTYEEEIYYKFFESLDIKRFLSPNIVYNPILTEDMEKSMLSAISLTTGLVQRNEEIIRKGDIIDNGKYKILQSFRKESEDRLLKDQDFGLIKTGQLILVLFSFLVIFIFLYSFRKDILENILKTSFILFLAFIFLLAGSMLINLNISNMYLIPFAILPIIIRTFYDSRLALFIHLVVILLLGVVSPLNNPFEFVFMQIFAGIVAIFSLANIRKRVQIFYSVTLIILAYASLDFAFSIIKVGELDKIEWTRMGSFGLNGLLVLASYPLIYIFEKVFGFLSDVTLMELSDTNSKLLRKLAEKAPGTFQHSMQVANMAEEVIYNIGGNPLLVRTGALYHDIGKMDMPMYFIENQSHGNNPHDNLEFDKSAEIIISHVTKGIEIAQKHNLPNLIIDFIRTHHGTSVVQFFYKNYVKNYPEAEVDIKKFTYPGPKPYSRETAVLMMADSIEAASRSLKTINDETIENLVNGIIDYQFNERQFEEANITFRDISIAKEILKRKLKNIYHARIEYPK
ncbi:MAG: HDIG domain-containing protein [Bacteroidales bacterium]|nr:HDIG domain-containing protein [Bacteroidales bacterium]